MSHEYTPSLTALEARNRISQIAQGMQVLHDEAVGQALDVGQEKRFNDLDDELSFRQLELSRFERSDNLTRSRAANPGVIKMNSTTDDITDDVLRLDASTVRDRVMRQVESRKSGRHLSARQQEHIEDLLSTRNDDTDGAAIGALILATENPHYKSAFQRTVSGGPPAFTPEEARAVNQVHALKRAMSIGTPSAGGFAVPALIDPTIILTGQGSPNPILRLARVETITNDTWRGLSSAGVSWGFHAEGTTVADNSPAVAQPSVATHRADGFIPFSIEVGQDWSSFAASMSSLLIEGYDELLTQKLTLGTSGSGEPDGLIASLDAVTNPAHIATTTAGAIGSVDVYRLWSALPARYRGNAAWFSSTGVQNSVRQLGTVDHAFSVDLTSEGVPSLFGKEYPTNDYMSDAVTGTTAASLLAVGDLKQGYLVAQRAGMTVEYVPNLFDTSTGRPTGQRGFFAWARIGAGLINPKAARLLVNKTS